MQIRLVIGDRDQRYLDNLVRYLEMNHMDTLEIVSFSRLELFREYVASGTADVILADEGFGVDVKELGKYGKAGYLCGGAPDTKQDGARRIAKFKKPDLIYKDILDLYAEGGSRRTFRAGNRGSGKLTLVTGCAGGTGASTFAAALARKYAFCGKKTLYLNLELTGNSADFFSGNGNYRFEDVIFALKSQRADVLLKMESAVRTDRSGVYFFEPCSTAMYMLELTQDDILKILDELTKGVGYEEIVVDMDFRLSGDAVEILARMDQIILVQDGGETSNSKFLRTMEALKILEKQGRTDVTGNMFLLYNRFSSSKSSSEIPGLTIPVLGKIPPIKYALTREIVEYMTGLPNIFDRL